ncbi:hypothetical protein SEA_RITA_86 [Mycobacterium phage Rita]|nr:hypothetical protein SEA_RITA_86 [Mycobacterium phage Rita]
MSDVDRLKTLGPEHRDRTWRWMVGDEETKVLYRYRTRWQLSIDNGEAWDDCVDSRDLPVSPDWIVAPWDGHFIEYAPSTPATEQQDRDLLDRVPDRYRCICRGDVVCAFHQTERLHDAHRCWGKPQCPFCNEEPGYTANERLLRDLAAEVSRLRAQETRIRELHRRGIWTATGQYYCVHCRPSDVRWPCKTIAALDTEGEA